MSKSAKKTGTASKYIDIAIEFFEKIGYEMGKQNLTYYEILKGEKGRNVRVHFASHSFFFTCIEYSIELDNISLEVVKFSINRYN